MSDKILSSIKITSYDFDPDATTATDIAWVDMSTLSNFVGQFVRTIGTSALTMTILANTASDGSGDEATIATNAFADGQPNAVGDYTFMEISDKDVAQKGSVDGKAYRYVSVNCTVATATDEAVVNYIATSKHCYEDLTSDNIA